LAHPVQVWELVEVRFVLEVMVAKTPRFDPDTV